MPINRAAIRKNRTRTRVAINLAGDFLACRIFKSSEGLWELILGEKALLCSENESGEKRAWQICSPTKIRKSRTLWSLRAPGAERARTDAPDNDTLPNQVHSQSLQTTYPPKP
ncbi:hypothetical protein B0H14DRAFT_2620853 [Mycena olivaceomarginata]|nr:hypothetical protein B0H14DRAFT_2620853 [Mycena olivaceomarginata]